MSEERPLIGVEDIGTPRWAEGYAATANAGLLDVARKAPRTVALAVRWAWQCSPALTLLAGVVQLAAGTATAFGLLATADVFTQLLATGPTPQRVVAALPAIATVVAAAAARGLLEAAVATVQGALVPRVEQRAQDELHAAVLEVELVAFDDADFVELVERATADGPTRVRACLRDTGELIAGLVSASAAVVTAGLLHPVLAPAVLLAALPQGWASVRSARLMFAWVVRTNSAHRRIGVTSRPITQRDPATEVRAFATQPVLLAEHRRISETITADAVRLERARTLVQLIGRTASGVGTGLAYGVLALLLYAGGLPLALAGTAALAMRMAGQAVGTAIYGINHLFEASFYLDLYRSCLADTAIRCPPRRGCGAPPPRSP